MQNSSLILTVDDICKIVQAIGLDALMDDMIKGIYNTLEHFNADKVQLISRDGFHYHIPDFGLIEWMPVHKDAQVTLKMVGYHPYNPQKNYLPTILSTIATYDTCTGHLLGLADATFLTALRTGAASAVASQILASPQSTQIGFIGCGAQAVTQLHALSRVFDIEKVWLFDCQMETAHSFPQRANFLDTGFQVVDAKHLPELLNNVDILCTCTSEKPGHGPVFEPSAYQNHLHINAVGSDFPGKTELPLSLLEKSKVVPDFIPQAIKEGECQQLDEAQIGVDLVELVQNADHYRDWQTQLTVFDSTGWALEDDVAIRLLLDLAHELKRGTQVQLECISHDPKNPYQFVNKHK
jgi:ornithine cyclodeaminase/alanine dehydrogenase-like protein (mu-crystallin family)